MSPFTKLGDRITLADLHSMSKSEMLKIVDPFASEYSKNRQSFRLSGISLTDYVRSCLIDEGILGRQGCYVKECFARRRGTS